MRRGAATHARAAAAGRCRRLCQPAPCAAARRPRAQPYPWLTAQTPRPSSGRARVRQGAVAALHARGVVHADLKPENLLLEQPLGADDAGACPQACRRIRLGSRTLSRPPCRACCCKQAAAPRERPGVAGAAEGAGRRSTAARLPRQWNPCIRTLPLLKKFT